MMKKLKKFKDHLSLKMAKSLRTPRLRFRFLDLIKKKTCTVFFWTKPFYLKTYFLSPVYCRNAKTNSKFKRGSRRCYGGW